jgi:hypothetical protein
MADNPDAGGWLRYPTMTPPAETEAPADPRDAARYPSIPRGRAPDGPRHAPDPAAATDVLPPAADEADQALRRRCPSMFAAPAEPATPPPEAAPAPESAPVLPEAYQGLQAPEGLEVDTQALAAVAPDLQQLGVTREQAQGLLPVLARLEAEAAAAAAATQASWRAEVERTLTPEARQSIAAVMRGAPPEVRDLLDRSGVGDNPHLVRWVAELGRRLGGVAPAPAPDDPHRTRYPNTRWTRWS